MLSGPMIGHVRVSPAFHTGTLAGDCNDSSDLRGFSSRIGSPENPKNPDNDDRFDSIRAIGGIADAGDNDAADFTADGWDLFPDWMINGKQQFSGGYEMKFKSIRSCVSLSLSMVMLVGSPVLASETVAIRSSDYQLGEEGVLSGSVLNQSGLPVAGLPVQVLHKEHVIATAVSDERGQFAVQGLRNGPHRVQLGATQQPVRFWSNTSAPPAAVSRMAIVVDEDVVRGQCGESCGEGCGEGFADGHHGAWKTAFGVLLIGGAVATTLALTLDDNDHAAVASP